MRSQCKHLWIALGFACTLAWIAAITPAHAALINLTPANGAANSATSVPLSQLNGTADSIQVGDKIMSGFVYSAIGDMPDDDDINVLGYKDPQGNWGLSFHGTFLDLPGGSASDALIRFIVNIDPTFLAQGYRISDAHLNLNGVGVGPSNSGFFVDESFAPDSNQTLHAFSSTFPGGTTQLSDTTTFSPPLTTLHVTKDILAIAGSESGQPARATMIDQSFSQTQIVPEPATILVSLIGALGLIGYRRHRYAN